ncbi:hypothetical protein [uncultured Campylobacter sp.]|uniref:hypothetical protein n=1 Tax=uncultured Campylobacter sp. TaxID=218934 RepID=UPI0028EE2EFD|nr:hypothetical protein [uncultured Campylobacter sp.]
MPFYSYAANFALLYYGVCCATHCSRFKISLRNFKAHRAAHPDFVAKALAQTPPAAELLKFHREILKFYAEAFKPCAACLLIQPR